MLILGIESATPVASAALADETGLLGEVLLNVGLTHSEQLLPVIDTLLGQCRRTIKDVGAIGVSAGPGSFTGLRIGMATAKALVQGLSHRSDKGDANPPSVRLVAVPTLEAMAWALIGQPVLVSPMLNARREQIYTGLYRWCGEAGTALAGAVSPSPEIKAIDAQALKETFARRQRGKKDRMPAGAGEGHWRLERLIEPEAVDPETWAERINAYLEGQASSLSRDPASGVYLLGDGAAMYHEIWERDIRGKTGILPPVTGLCRGSYIALAAMNAIQHGGGANEKQDFYRMKPIYLRGI